MIQFRSSFRSALLMALCVTASVAVVQFSMTTAANAQAISTNGGSIQGTVTDSTGAVIPNATVTVTNPDTGSSKVLTTDAAGFYSIGPLIPGNYTVSIKAANFPNEELQVGVERGT